MAMAIQVFEILSFFHLKVFQKTMNFILQSELSSLSSFNNSSMKLLNTAIQLNFEALSACCIIKEVSRTELCSIALNSMGSFVAFPKNGD
jgi:hypothetical protein